MENPNRTCVAADCNEPLERCWGSDAVARDIVCHESEAVSRDYTDSEIQAALRADKEFKEKAAQEVQKAHSLSENSGSEPSKASDSHRLEEQIEEAMRKMF